MIATTTASLLRGTTTSAFGDVVEDNTGAAVASDVPCSLIERSRTVLDPVSGDWVEVTMYYARFVAGTFPAKRGDRFRDESTTELYWIRRVKETRRSISGLGALRLEMSRTRPE